METTTKPNLEAHRGLGRDVRHGSGSGVGTIDNPSFMLGGMGGFRFTYKKTDHHICDMYIGPFPEGPGHALYHYIDDSHHPAYTWRYEHQELPSGAVMHEVRGTNEYGFGINKVLHPPGLPGVPVLVGFSLGLRKNHHLKKLRVELFRDQFDQIELGLSFEDKSADTPFSYRVRYAMVPAANVVRMSCPSGSDRGVAVRDLTGSDRIVLQGFSLEYTKADHHIDEIGVWTGSGKLSVALNDKNNDDKFNWSVRYVELQ